jgi:DNA processing protein
MHSGATKYQGPSEIISVDLSTALKETLRFPRTKQLDLLSGETTIPRKFDLNLYFSGDLDLLKRPCVAIIGARQISEAGLLRARRLAKELVEAGIVVVSGLAKGVDTVAHTTAIERGGNTVAVIGTPLDRASPTENSRLQEHIYRNHLLISRTAVGEKTYRSSFPLRNKLMAVLSDATVIIEASDSSGTLHQAAECVKLGRWLFVSNSILDDPELTWPKKYMQHDTCVPLGSISDITSRIPSAI